MEPFTLAGDQDILGTRSQLRPGGQLKLIRSSCRRGWPNGPPTALGKGLGVPISLHHMVWECSLTPNLAPPQETKQARNRAHQSINSAPTRAASAGELVFPHPTNGNGRIWNRSFQLCQGSVDTYNTAGAFRLVKEGVQVSVKTQNMQQKLGSLCNLNAAN